METVRRRMACSVVVVVVVIDAVAADDDDNCGWSIVGETANVFLILNIFTELASVFKGFQIVFCLCFTTRCVVYAIRVFFVLEINQSRESITFVFSMFVYLNHLRSLARFQDQNNNIIIYSPLVRSTSPVLKIIV